MWWDLVVVAAAVLGTALHERRSSSGGPRRLVRGAAALDAHKTASSLFRWLHATRRRSGPPPLKQVLVARAIRSALRVFCARAHEIVHAEPRSVRTPSRAESRSSPGKPRRKAVVIADAQSDAGAPAAAVYRAGSQKPLRRGNHAVGSGSPAKPRRSSTTSAYSCRSLSRKRSTSTRCLPERRRGLVRQRVLHWEAKLSAFAKNDLGPERLDPKTVHSPNPMLWDS